VNFKQLSAFREVMLTGSVSKAAHNLHRTQPAVSSLIASLEEGIGFKLFSRMGGRLHPVPEAYYLLEEAAEILNRLDTSKRTMKSIRDLKRGVIRVVSMPGPSVFLLPHLIGRFVTGRDDVRVSLITRSSFQVQQLVSVQQYDVGLADLGLDAAAESPLVDHDVMRFECLCALRADDPIAQKELVTARDLDGKPLATLYTDHSTFTQTKRAFDEMGARFNMRFETQYFIPLFTFVEQGLAYSIVDPLSAESYRIYRSDNGCLVFRPFLPAVCLVSSIMTPTHRPASNLARAFTTAMKDELLRIREHSPV
jgi:DNA-binding transcriptional LysR family regulator